MLPIWAHINQVTSFASSEVVVASDADTGMQTLDNGDLLHPSQAGVHQYAEVVAAWVANTSTEPDRQLPSPCGAGTIRSLDCGQQEGRSE